MVTTYWHGRDYGDNLWKFRNHVIALGSQTCFAICKTHWKFKKRDGFHIMVLSSNLIAIRFWVEFPVGELITEVPFPFDLDLCGQYRQATAQVGGA